MSLEQESMHVLNHELRRMAESVIRMSVAFAEDPAPIYAHQIAERASTVACLSKQLLGLQKVAD